MVFDPNKYGPKGRKKPKKRNKYLYNTALCCAFWTEGTGATYNLFAMRIK